MESPKSMSRCFYWGRRNFSCNFKTALKYGIADTDLTRLQRVQNQLACLVIKSSPFTRSISLLRSLHWLPLRFRILFKINLLTYKTLSEKQPVYLHSMLAASIPSRSLRSNNDNSLSVPRVKTNTGARAFHSCAPSLWNNLPLSVCLFRQFICHLQEISEDTSLWFSLFLIDTVSPHGLLMLRDFFLDFAVEH